MIVVIKMTHRAVCIIACKHISNAYGASIQLMSILPGCVFMRSKTDRTFIGAIAVDGVTWLLIWHHHPQTEQHANPIIFSVQYQWVATPKWMHVATSSIVTGQKANKNNSYHYYRNIMVVWWVLKLIGVTQQPAQLMRSHTYGRDAGIKEKLAILFLVIVVWAKHRKNTNVNGFSILGPIIWWYL